MGAGIVLLLSGLFHVGVWLISGAPSLQLASLAGAALVAGPYLRGLVGLRRPSLA